MLCCVVLCCVVRTCVRLRLYPAVPRAAMSVEESPQLKARNASVDRIAEISDLSTRLVKLDRSAHVRNLTGVQVRASPLQRRPLRVQERCLIFLSLR